MTEVVKPIQNFLARAKKFMLLFSFKLSIRSFPSLFFDAKINNIKLNKIFFILKHF